MIGCVSVSLKDRPPQKATGVKFQAPPEPFHPIAANSGDAAWKNAKTGSVISFLSDCGADSKPTLEQIRDDVINGLQLSQILRERRITVDGTEALRSAIFCQVDGIDTRIELTVFNKDGCSFVLTLVGRPQSIEGDGPAFENFLVGFKTP